MIPSPANPSIDMETSRWPELEVPLTRSTALPPENVGPPLSPPSEITCEGLSIAKNVGEALLTQLGVSTREARVPQPYPVVFPYLQYVPPITRDKRGIVLVITR